MTTIDKMLRRAAAAMPDNPARVDEILERGRRRHRHQIEGAVAAGLAVAVSATLVVLFGAGTDAAQLNELPPAAPPSSATTTGTPTPTATVPPGEVITAGSATVTLPAGWEVSDRSTPFLLGEAEPGSEVICIEPVAAAEEDGCDGGLEISHGTVGGSEGSVFTAHQPAGWYHGTGVIPCPVDGADGATTNFAYAGRSPSDPVHDPIETGTRQVGGLDAIYDVWSGYCESGYTFTPRSWYLPEKKVQFLTYLSPTELGVDPETILSWVRFS